MSKKSDTPRILAAPASTAGSALPARARYVSGAILQKTSATATEPSPAAAEPLPAERRPAVDDYLDTPDDSHRWERIGGLRKEASPATPDHGDPHFLLDELLGPHLVDGYVGSVDLKTRVDDKQEYASDTCVRREGVDPSTGRRYLEELVFEVAYKRSKKETDARAESFAKRGVRRQIGIFPRQRKVCEWSEDTGAWRDLDLDDFLEDECLVRPLPIAALFDAAKAEVAVARALEAKDNPAIVEMKKKSEKRGEKRGQTLGRARGRAESILDVLSVRGLALPEEQRERILATTDLETLERWLRLAASASSRDELLDQV